MTESLPARVPNDASSAARAITVVHLAGMCAIGFAAVLLIAPASFHRIAENGEDSERVVAIGSRFVLLSLVPLAVGIALDVWVVAQQIRIAAAAGAVLAGGMLAASAAVWFVYPFIQRVIAPGRNSPRCGSALQAARNAGSNG